MATFDVFQQTFGMSIASNGVGHDVGTQADLQQALQDNLPALIERFGPQWRVAWGPVVWKNTPEDPETAQPNPATSYISIGTALALQKHYTIPAPAGVAGSGTTLYSFLSGIPSSGPSRVIFTGHSLGATLASSLALATVESNLIRGTTTRVYVAAGASPGNGPFVETFSRVFPSSSTGTDYKVWNRNLVNTFDVVPQAWCTDPELSPEQNIFKIPGMFGPPGPLEIQFAVGLFNQLIGETGIVYMPLPARSFTGPPPPTPAPTTIEEFVAVALMQHESPYAVFAGFPPTEENVVLGKGLARKTRNQIVETSSVIGELVWVAEHKEEAGARVASRTA
ncbi:hypothetical protein BD779DRAFT_371264 [Infundibulicybe gibba]|nr:hypothetical protein BD779DRAFT_371264 [Infundibulicybe gibba]